MSVAERVRRLQQKVGASAILAVLALVLWAFPAPAHVQETPAPPLADRFAQVFDTRADRGKLVARFLKMSLVSEAEEKSGDCSVLSLPDGETMLVDAGSPECADQVIRCLKAMGIARLDAILISHPHVDHLGGLPKILERFSAPLVYMSELEYPSGPYKAVLAAAAAKGMRIVRLEEGSAFEMGGARFEVFNPEPDIAYYDGYPANGTQFINNRSLVVRITYGKASMLYMGDVYAPRELELAEKYGSRLAADVIKVGHHGSGTSSSASFIRIVAPKIAVMMHDKPASPQVYRRYRKVGAAVSPTALDGCVRVASGADGDWATLTQFDRRGRSLD